MGSQLSCSRPDSGAPEAWTRIAPSVAVIRHSQRASTTATMTASLPGAVQLAKGPEPQPHTSNSTLEGHSAPIPTDSDDLAITAAPKEQAAEFGSRANVANNRSISLPQGSDPSSSTTAPMQSSSSYNDPSKSARTAAAPSTPSGATRSRGSGRVLELGHRETPEPSTNPQTDQTRRFKRQSMSSIGGSSTGGDQTIPPNVSAGRRASLPTVNPVKWSFISVHQGSEPVVNENQPDQTSSSGFACFSDFPVEIRLLIFQFCAFVPRTVPIYYNLDRSFFFSSHPPPPILQVCREARLEARKFYKQAFGTKALFNLCVDTVFLENPIGIAYVRNDNLFITAYHPVRQTPAGDPTSCLSPLLRMAKKDELQAIRFLALGCNGKAFPKHHPPQTWNTIGTHKQLKEKALPNLEVLTFALDMNKLSFGKSIKKVSSFEQVQDRKKDIGHALELRLLPLQCDEKWKERAKTYIEAAAKYYEWDGLDVAVMNLWVGLRENAAVDQKSPQLALQHDAYGRLDVNNVAQNAIPRNPHPATLRMMTASR